MDGLDKITLVLMVCLVAVALLFPLSAKRPRENDEDDIDIKKRR